MSLNKNHSKWLVLLVILTAPLLYVIDIFIINMAIPIIKSQLVATQGEVQLIIAGYLLGSACFLIIGGRAGDYLGRKKVFSGECFISQSPPVSAAWHKRHCN